MATNNLRAPAWTPKEDSKLLRAARLAVNGNGRVKWSKLHAATKFKDRTIGGVRQRLRKLMEAGALADVIAPEATPEAAPAEKKTRKLKAKPVVTIDYPNFCPDCGSNIREWGEARAILTHTRASKR